MTRTLLALGLVLTLAACKDESRACGKMKALCGTELDACKSMRESVRTELGSDALDKLGGCLLSSSTCGEATGCTTGAALKATGEAAKSFRIRPSPVLRDLRAQQYLDDRNRKGPSRPTS